MLKYAAFLVVLFSPNFIALINGCTCAPEVSPEQSFAKATHIFIGKAFRTRPSVQSNEYQAVFQVEKSFKGSLPSGDNITVSTDYDAKACGVPLRSGERWQVWTYGAVDSPKVQLCSPTTKDVTQNIDFLTRHTSSTSRCQQSIAMIITSLFALIGYHLLAPTI